MVLADCCDNLAVQAVFQRDIDAFFDVRNDNKCAHRWSEIVVRILARLRVFCKILRFHKFADVVKICADPADCGVSADSLCGGFHEVGHSKAMVVGAGGFHAHPFEQGVVKIAHFQPGNIRRDFEQMLKHREDAADDDRRANAGGDRRQTLPTDHPPVSLSGRFPDDRADLAERCRQNPRCDADIDSCPNQPAASADLEGHIDCNKAGNQRNN